MPTATAAAVPAQVARYARGGADYHDLLKDRLRAVADVLHARVPGCRTRAVVDTAPLLERDFARLAGLGWFGKNTMLIHKRAGSYLLLGALLTDVELEPDQPHATSHCGTCTRCLDVCPTDAFPEPYQLDARKCISYLTIELKGPIPLELRSGIGDWLFGCDLCQEVCPWNRKSPTTTDPVFQPRPDLAPADALDMLRLTRDEFRLRFRDSPLNRPGYGGLRRNAAIVLGNSSDAVAVPILIATLADADPVVRGAVAWALGQLGGAAARTALQERHGIEDNPDVLHELNAALQHHNSADAQG
jgi:epoxyqueuosine reductase